MAIDTSQRMVRGVEERHMTDRRFVFAFPGLNLYEVIWAVSAVEARHKLINSSLAPYYGQAVLLNP